MKNKSILAAVIAISFFPLAAFAASYYWTSSGTSGGRSSSTAGPFPTLSQCQESLAKAMGNNIRKDVTFTGCVAK